MSKNRKSKKRDRGVLAEAGRFARRNRRALGLAGTGLAAAALFLGQRYRGRRIGRWNEDEAIGGAAV